MGKHKKDKKDKKDRKRSREYDSPFTDDRDDKGADGGDRKARKKVEKIARALGYSNDTNPFGDSNLLKPFVWGKKQQQDGVSGGGADTAETRLSLMKDIERVRERRKKREEELEEMERLRTEEVRLREAALYSDWQEKEEQFHMKQTEVRSAMRIVDSRLHPIDRIAQGILLIEAYRTIEADGVEKCLSIAQSLVSIDAQQSLDVVSALESDDLEEFIKDATDFVQLESTKRLHKSEPSAMFDDFWKSLLHVACGEKKKRLARRESAVHKSVDADIAALLDGKSMSDLCRLVQDIERSIQTGRETDTEYWHLMLEDIRLEIEKRRFVTAFVLMQKEQEEILAILAPQLAVAAAAAAASHSSAEDGVYTIERSTIADDDAEVGDSDENMQASDEVVLQAKVYSWVDKYRPRKPRYLNRVKTGYDWNKYNQTHYDHDNPPPRTVQGYKFSIFYPDLIDATIAPKYFLEPADEKQFAIIRFHAGPPYEDIAFKIVNREWERGRRSGFKCVFERGVLQLQFNFTRVWYRR